MNGMSEHVAAATLEANEQWHCFEDDRKTFASLKALCLQMLSSKTEERLTAFMILSSEVLKGHVAELIEAAPSLGKLHSK